MKSFVATVKYNYTLQCYQVRVNGDLIGRELRRSDDLAAVMVDVCPNFSNKQFSHDVWMSIVLNRPRPNADVLIEWNDDQKRFSICDQHFVKTDDFKCPDAGFLHYAASKIYMRILDRQRRQQLDQAFIAGMMTNY